MIEFYDYTKLNLRNTLKVLTFMVDPHTGVNGFLTELALLKHTLRLRNNNALTQRFLGANPLR